MHATLILLCGFAFVLSILATAMVRALARRFGAVARPKPDRWHTTPTAMFGGIAICIAVIGTVVPFLPANKEIVVVLGASFAMFVLGLVDDLLQIKPYQKLIGQLLGAAAVIYFGLVLPWTASLPINMLITFFWLIGVTNAVNMLDNMDGLATGVAAIAAIALAAAFYTNGQAVESAALAVFASVLLGFLVFNHNPASIFMGDCGSMFIGFFLASTALMAANGGGGRSRSIAAVLAVPVLVLCIPIFDTTFVTVMRKLAGRAASQGGRDHTSHRLVALGLTERKAVWMLYTFAALGALTSTTVHQADLDVALLAIATFVIALSIIGVYLAGVRVYSEEELAAANQKPLMSFLVDLSYKRRVFEVILDMVLIVAAYYGAYRLTLGIPPAASSLFVKTLPVVIFVKLAAFYLAGIYRGLWRYASLADVFVYAKSVAAGSILTVVAIVFTFRLEEFSRQLFILDAAMLFLAVAASRFAFRIMRRLIPASRAVDGRRIAIYGAGDGGELLYRELRNNASLRLVPVAFLDDDPRKIGKLLHGLPVYAPTSFAELRASAIVEVLVSTKRIPEARLHRLLAHCTAEGISVQQMQIDIRPLRSEARSTDSAVQATAGTDRVLSLTAPSSTIATDH